MRSVQSRSVQSLQAVATDKIVSQLGRVAEGINSRFTCSGKYEVPSSKPIKLVYRQAGLVSSKEWNSVELPGVSEAAMIKLLEACSVASYEHKGKDVVDKSYRNAFKLEPDDFTTSFQICSTPILQEIQSIISTVVGLKADLYKLNTYASGGFFKAHVDTPRSERMFGSLVVCLPTHFSGGELILHHQEEEIKYDWSSTATDTSSKLHWAAFFSDIEHEVLPVSEGYRVTLTYNLSYHSKSTESTFDVKKYSFYKFLQSTLSNPVFMCDGGVLGFNSYYLYVFDTQWADILTNINTIEDKVDTFQRLKVPCDKFIHLSKDKQVKVLRDAGIEDMNCKQILDGLPSDFPLLKGADYIVVESAKSLGLPVCVKPFLSSDGGGAYADDRVDRRYALKDFSLSFGKNDDKDDYCVNAITYVKLFGDTVCTYKPEDITWCQKLSCHQPARVALAYGNEAMLKVWYKSAAILIRNTKWSDHRQKLITISTGEYCGVTEASKTDEAGVVEDFKDIIHEDIVQEETQQLHDQLKDLLDMKCINEVEGLVNLLKEIKERPKLNRHVKCRNVRMQVENLCRIKNNLYSLRYMAESDHRYKVDHLCRAMHELKQNFQHFCAEETVG